MRLIGPALLFLCFPFLSECRKSRQIWRKPVVTWLFSDPHQLIRSETTLTMLRSLTNTSLSLWEAALAPKIRLEEVTEKPADIEIYFARGAHGDKEALDGPGGMVAHSGLPPRGYLHLDADEKWSFDGEKGLDLRYVILHETGHLLGLRHIWKKKSIMNPYYRRLKQGMALSTVDIESIRNLYKLPPLPKNDLNDNNQL